MRSVQFKSKSNEKLINIKKYKKTETVKTDKNPALNQKSDTNNEVEVTRPGSCPNHNSSFVPSRNWHQYLSGQQPISREPNTDRPHSVDKNAEPHLYKPTDELITIKLPTVNFCSAEKEAHHKHEGPSIADLSDEDKRNIAYLVEELARCKQERLEDEETILMLKNKVAELKTSLKKLLAEKHSENKSISLIKSIHLNEETALKKQLAELNQLLYEMQVQKSTSEVHMKTITAQAEKMTRAIHAMHRENTELQIELRVTKEKLAMAQQVVEKMTKDLNEVHKQITPVTEDKACQSSEDIGLEKIHVKTIEGTTEHTPEDHQILSEIFFNKYIQNSFSPKETIIFLPAEIKAPFDRF